MRGGEERGSWLLDRGAVWKGRNQGGVSVCRSSPTIVCGREPKERCYKRIDTSRTTGSSKFHPQCTGTGGRVVSGRAGVREEGGGGVKGA